MPSLAQILVLSGAGMFLTGVTVRSLRPNNEAPTEDDEGPSAAGAIAAILLSGWLLVGEMFAWLWNPPAVRLMCYGGLGLAIVGWMVG